MLYETTGMINFFVYTVAPHAGAWIETLSSYAILLLSLVAPHAGAWIETSRRTPLPTKQCVAPHAGAWIETTSKWTAF